MPMNSLGVVPKDDDDKPEDPKRSRLSFSLGPLKFEAVGKFLEQRGAVLGLAVIAGSILAVILLIGEKIGIGRLFK